MDKKIKIAIWMNIPSHYQRAFFDALYQRSDVDLQVRYAENVPSSRKAQGWSDFQFYDYEQCLDEVTDPWAQLQTMPDWRERIHIISCVYHSALAKIFSQEKVRWCHWSETPGCSLAKKLFFKPELVKMAMPLFLKLKQPEYRMAREYADCVFGQGKLAIDAFEQMGIQRTRCYKLFYTPNALMPPENLDEKIVRFAAGRKVFLTVCMLNKRKGIDLILRAFASLKVKDWCVVLCGKDLSEGWLERLAKKLNIADQVLFRGPVSFPQLNSVYAACTVNVLASRFDGWGAVLNEGASLSMPLIGSDGAGAAWEVIQEGENGFRFKNGSWKDLAKKMTYFVEHPKMIQKYGIRSKAIFDAEFSPAKNAERLVEALEKIK